ncbi:hypothetical protein AAG906_014530 [Vitis piasezkii]
MATGTILEDQKKRTLEALERRFAVAKAELLQQQEHLSKKRFRGVDEKVSPCTNSFSVGSSTHPTDSSVTPTLNASLKKGHATSQDVEANGPAYSQLSQTVHENLLATNAKITSKRGSTADKILHELLKNGDSAHKYMMGSRSMKFDNWILLDNVVQGRGASGARIRDLLSHSKNSRKHISMKQNKRCGSLNLPQELHRYDIFKPMHDMWKGYIMQLLKNTGKNQLVQPLLSADLHGAIILVVECKIAAFNGVSGIMIRETAETLGIITQDDKFRGNPSTGRSFKIILVQLIHLLMFIVLYYIFTYEQK